MPPAVEVLVVSYGSADVIAHLLTSLGRVLPDAPVALREHSPDPAAAAGLHAVAARHPAPVRVEHDPTNPGFGAGCNALAAGSTADFLVFLNPDTELVSWPWTDTAPPSGTVVGATMTDDAHQHYGRSYRIRDEIALSWLRRQPTAPEGAGYVSGAALLVERDAFDRLGGFDPGFFMFYEDVDLCLRANAAGLRTVVEPGWVVRHERHHSTTERFGQALIWSYESAVRFHRKHGSPVGAYRAYKLADAVSRALLHLFRGRGTQAAAYWALTRRVVKR